MSSDAPPPLPLPLSPTCPIAYHLIEEIPLLVQRIYSVKKSLLTLSGGGMKITTCNFTMARNLLRKHLLYNYQL